VQGPTSSPRVSFRSQSAAASSASSGPVRYVLVFPPLQLRPAEHAVRQWGDDVAAALDDLADAAAGRYSPGRSWPRHERRLSGAAEQARAAARNARESLRWNPRAKVERAVPRPDGVVLDSLEELTARTRAVARVLLDAAGDESLSLPASFGESYAAMLRTLTGPVRQLADPRSAPPDGDELAGASGCQDDLERQAGQLTGSTGNENAARHLAGLSRQLVNELARKSGDRN